MAKALAMIRCDAMKIGWKQDKDGYILTLRLHPQDAKRTPEIGEADIGSQWQLTLVELDDDGNAREVMRNIKAPDRMGLPRDKTPPDPAAGITLGRAYSSRGGVEKQTRLHSRPDGKEPDIRSNAVAISISGKAGAGIAPGPRDTNATPAAIDDPDEQRPEQPEACVDGRQMPGEIKAGPSRGGATPALNHAGEAPGPSTVTVAAMAHKTTTVASASPRGEPAPEFSSRGGVEADTRHSAKPDSHQGKTGRVLRALESTEPSGGSALPTRAGVAPGPRDANHAGEGMHQGPTVTADGTNRTSASRRGGPAPVHAGEVPAVMAHGNETVWSSVSPRGEPAPVSNAGDISTPARGAAPPQPPSQAAPRPFTSLPLSQQAGMLCNDPRFWAYLNEEHLYSVYSDLSAAEALRVLCCVFSRAEIKFGTEAGKHFTQIRDRFFAWKMVA